MFKNNQLKSFPSMMQKKLMEQLNKSVCNQQY